MNNTSDLDVCNDTLYPGSEHDDVGYHFLWSGRPGSDDETRGRCIVIAVAMFRFPDGDTLSRDFHFWNGADGNKGAHSETLILNRLQETENKLKSNVEVLKLYGSLSPCSECCERLIDFLNERPSCKLHVAFSRVYKYEEEEHRSALRDLKSHLQVKALDVFKEQDWEFLRTRGNLKLSLAEKQWMDRFDTFWRMKLNDILQDGQPTQPQDIAAPSPTAATTQNQNTVSPKCGAQRIKKKGFVTKPGRPKRSWLRKRSKIMRKNQVINSTVTSRETEEHESAPASVNSGQQIYNNNVTLWNNSPFEPRPIAQMLRPSPLPTAGVMSAMQYRRLAPSIWLYDRFEQSLPRFNQVAPQLAPQGPNGLWTPDQTSQQRKTRRWYRGSKPGFPPRRPKRNQGKKGTKMT